MALLQVQTTAKPEEVLEAVAQCKPARAEVDELYAALHHIGSSGAEVAIDRAQQAFVDLVLGVEHTNDVAAAERKGRVERLGLVLRPAPVNHDADTIRVSPSDGIRD